MVASIVLRLRERATRASRAPAYARLQSLPSYGASAEAFGGGGNGEGLAGPRE